MIYLRSLQGICCRIIISDSWLRWTQTAAMKVRWSSVFAGFRVLYLESFFNMSVRIWERRLLSLFLISFFLLFLRPMPDASDIAGSGSFSYCRWRGSYSLSALLTLHRKCRSEHLPYSPPKHSPISGIGCRRLGFGAAMNQILGLLLPKLVKWLIFRFFELDWVFPSSLSADLVFFCFFFGASVGRRILLALQSAF